MWRNLLNFTVKNKVVKNMSEEKGEIRDFYLLKRLAYYLKPYRTQFFLLIITTITYAVISVLIPHFIQQLIDEHLPNKDYESMAVIFYLMVTVLVVQSLLILCNTYLSAWVGQMTVKDIRVKLYAHILKLRFTFFDNTPIGLSLIHI